MKKTMFIFAIGSLFLTACSADAPKEADPNELPPGIMQPVAGSGAQTGSFGWASDIQATSMPANMK